VPFDRTPLDCAQDRPFDYARDRPFDCARDRPLDCARDRQDRLCSGQAKTTKADFLLIYEKKIGS